jgi:hypothetical protein
MFKAGKESWRIGIGGDQAVHALLYIRDACRLTPTGADVPPPLVGDIPDFTPAASALELFELSAAWLDWWRRFIHFEGAVELGEFARDVDQPERRTSPSQLESFGRVFDPPEFGSLSESRRLQEVARQVSPHALRWWSENRENRHPRGEPAERKSAWSSYRSVAESIIEDYQVRPGRVAAGVIVLAVDGPWSNITEPGVLLCSEESFADREAFLVDLKRTFETGLRRSA